MDDQIRIELTAKDGTTKVFEAIGRSGKKLGDEIKAGSERGSAGLKDLTASAETFERRAMAMGATIGTAIGVISKLGASYRDQRLDLQSLEAQYGTSADAVIDFTEAIQDSFNQSNDAARDSALVFATLYRNYQFGEEQVLGLMERTADVSAARGRSMTETSQMIQNALRGEAEYIEQIGVTLNDTYVASEYAARGLGNWNTLTDEAAKAQFRYILLLEQTADTQGRAGEEADRAGGLMRRWINELQDAGQTLGGMAGPAGEMAAEFSQIAIGLPVIAGGLGKVAGAARNSTIAMRALSLAAGPVGALTLGIGLLGLAFVQNRREAAEAAEVIATLKDAYLDLKVAADAAGDSGDVATEARLNQLRHQVESVRAESDLIVKTMEDASQFKLFGKDYDRDDWFELKEAYEITDQEAQSLADSQAKLGAAMQDSTIDAEALSAAQGDLYDQFIRQEITAEQFEMQLADLAANTDKYKLATDDASRAQQAWNAAMADGMLGARDLGMLANVAVNSIDNLRRGYRDANAVIEETTETLSLNEQALSGAADAMEVLGNARREAFAGVGEDFLAIANAEAEEYAAWLDVVADNLNRLLAVAGFDDPLSMWNLSGHASDSAELAMNLTNAAEALDTIYRVVVSNTSGIASQVDGIQTWADELINVRGEYGEIDRLLGKNLITQEQYNDAQRSYNQISIANLQIQDDVLAIQAMQVPLIADQTSATAEYLRQIRQMPAEQQLITLGWMDATTAGRAMEFQTLAVAAANGELGTSGEAAFSAMITGAAQADPVLKALLIDMGLISEGADGTISVNLSGAEGARSEIGALTDAIVAFIDLTDDGTINGSFSIDAEDNATPTMESIQSSRDELAGSTATVMVDVVDNASGTIDYISNQLGLLDGNVAVTYIRTMYETYGTVPSYVGPTMESGGYFKGYMAGGYVTLAESFPEAVYGAGGYVGMAMDPGIYRIQEGSYVSPGPSSAGNSFGGITVNVNVGGSVVAERELTHSIARAISAELQGAAEENWGGYA